MHDENAKEDALPAAEAAIRRYQESDPIPPLMAYSIEMLAKVKFGEKDKEAVDELREKAGKIDPFHSRALGMPSRDLFVPPGDLSPVCHRYLFRPF
jgi:hypothetical protein